MSYKFQKNAQKIEVFTLPHAFLKESLGTPGISGTPQGISWNFPDSCLQKWPLILGQNEPGVCQESLWSPCEIRDFSRTPQDWPFKESLRSARTPIYYCSSGSMIIHVNPAIYKESTGSLQGVLVHVIM